MEFESKHYFTSACERLEQAQALYRRDGNSTSRVNMHPVAMYLAGVAVECMLRAYITRRKKGIDGRHHIVQLYEESGMWRVSAGTARSPSLTDSEIDKIKRELDAAVNRVDQLWQNNYRYASEARLRSFLFEIGEHKNIKGDVLKENLRRLIDSSSVIITKGTLLWKAIPSSPVE